ncbi:hypothetical protein RND71_026205 [Anisodus tanguticus]|uniref:Uncharacterized protein n=1 Tax=Anisodus tanguticus TaxID=243964 RepID=A0AAE1V852_9SOLA|nr:hypothetical protein RND71_026205 [Anisodus tanguticus]
MHVDKKEDELQEQSNRPEVQKERIFNEKSLQEEEGWKTITKGKGSNKVKANTSNQQKEVLEISKSVFSPILDVADLNYPVVNKETFIFGMTFSAQEKFKGEAPNNKRGKRKVIATLKIIQENTNQNTARKARNQKKVMEVTNPPYERRTRCKKGYQDEDNNCEKIQLVTTQPKCLEAPSSSVVTTSKEVGKTKESSAYLDSMKTGKDIIPVDREKESEQVQNSGKDIAPHLPEKEKGQDHIQGATYIVVDNKEEDKYNHFESESEVEMEEDQFHDVPDP